jgi:hypothetical protein
MGMPRKIKIDSNETLGGDPFIVSEVGALRNFEKSTPDNPVQAIDEETGERVWTVEVLDGSADARKSDRHFTVKLIAPVQPTLPPVPQGYPAGVPFRPVEFIGMTATPWVDDSSPRPRLAWSFRATGMQAPKFDSKPRVVKDAGHDAA